MKKKAIFLSGPMDNFKPEEVMAWRQYVYHEMSLEYDVYVPFLNDITEADGREMWNRDYYMLDHSDIILINIDYPDDKPYLGTSAEMGRAFYQNKPIIMFSRYNWVHQNPTLQHHAAKILKTVDEAMEYIRMFYK